MKLLDHGNECSERLQQHWQWTNLLRLVENRFHCDHNNVPAKMEQISLPQVLQIIQFSHPHKAIPTAHKAKQSGRFAR